MPAVKRIPSIAVVMTPFPHSIGAERNLADAHAMMEEYGMHHLPVTSDERLVGVVSHRDLAVAEATGGDRDTTLGTIYTREPYVVDMHIGIDEVALEMARRRIGSALVTRHDKLVGIVTFSDLAQFIGTTLRELFPPPGDDEIA